MLFSLYVVSLTVLLTFLVLSFVEKLERFFTRKKKFRANNKQVQPAVLAFHK
ncbi:hypothetical protein [Radiobacillus sp. PE A8.2]|uniref:hypothetical protein n=1 Tax=Radiobacillus sp. PE A8.2 TaxID=3380349 RepID=UPI00388E14CB